MQMCARGVSSSDMRALKLKSSYIHLCLTFHFSPPPEHLLACALCVRATTQGEPQRLQQRLRSACDDADASGGAVRTWDELYDCAAAARPTLEALLMDVVAAAGGDGAGVRIISPPPGHELKGRTRAAQKARDDYSDRSPGPAFGWVFDILRSAIVCETPEMVEVVLKLLTQDPSEFCLSLQSARYTEQGFRVGAGSTASIVAPRSCKVLQCCSKVA